MVRICNIADIWYKIDCEKFDLDGKKGKIRWGHPISGGFSYYVLKFRQNNGPFQTEVAKIGSFGLLGKIQPDSNYEVRVFTGAYLSWDHLISFTRNRTTFSQISLFILLFNWI